MCFNAQISLLTFILGLIGSIALIRYGNAEYIMENNIYGIFLIFIVGIQLMDFLFWIDLKNTIGINKLATIIGPLFNVAQPIILYIIKVIFLKPNILSGFNLPVAILNIAYFINIIYNYILFISNGVLHTSTSHGHLAWPWLKYFNPYFYLILFAINIFYLSNFKYALALFSIIYFLLYLSYKYFKYNMGELWCFFGSFVPIIMLLVSHFL